MVNPTDANIESSAHSSILGALSKFENAIQTLADTVEDTRQKIDHVADLSSRSTEEIAHIKETVMPYVDRAKDASKQVVSTVKDNPRPIAMALVGLVGGLLIWSFFQGRDRQRFNQEVSVH